MKPNHAQIVGFVEGHSAIKKFAINLLMFIFLNPSMAQQFTGKRHSITPIFGIANNYITPFSIMPNPSLKIDYSNGDELRTPVSLRYQYRMRHGIQLGIDFLGNYNPLSIHPAYYTQMGGFIGPHVPRDGTMLGGDFHFSKTIEIKLIEAFGFIGIGGYSQRFDNNVTRDYSWYISAPSEFYEFAVASTNNTIKKFMPITKFGIGARFNHLEVGINREYSLGSPVKSFDYQGVNYENNIRFRSIGFYVAYRYEF